MLIGNQTEWIKLSYTSCTCENTCQMLRQVHAT